MGNNFKEAEVALANRNLGMPLEFLATAKTPTESHYRLSHFDLYHWKGKDEDWDLKFALADGTVVGDITLQKLKDETKKDETKAPPRLCVTMECAGNGRRLITDRHFSMPWAYEAVSTAVWDGTPLLPLLRSTFGAHLTRDTDRKSVM